MEKTIIKDPIQELENIKELKNRVKYTFSFTLNHEHAMRLKAVCDLLGESIETYVSRAVKIQIADDLRRICPTPLDLGGPGAGQEEV